MEIPGYGQLDSGMMANGILEVIPEGFGFIRCENYMPGTNDVYVSPAQIRRFNLRTGDIVCGNIKVKTEKESEPLSPITSIQSSLALSWPTKHQLPLAGIPLSKKKQADTVSSAS